MLKKLILVNLIVILALVLAACAPAATPAPAEATEATVAEAPAASAPAAPSDCDITFIVYTDASVEFFVPVVKGAEDAAKLFNCTLDIQYGDSDPVKQNNLIESAIANKVDAIAVMIPDDSAFDETICKAMDAGIGVVSMNVDDAEGSAGNCRMAFMGQNFVDTGYLIARRMIEEHGIGEGDLVFTPVEAPEAVYAIQRYEGVKKALEEVGATAEQVGTGFNLADVQTTEVQFLLGNPDTKAIIALGSAPLTVAPKAIEEAGVDIPLGGFDLTQDIIDSIQSGVITATVDQQPYSQGFYSVAQLALWKMYGLFPSNMDTGGEGLIDKTNVDQVEALVGTYR